MEIEKDKNMENATGGLSNENYFDIDEKSLEDAVKTSNLKLELSYDDLQKYTTANNEMTSHVVQNSTPWSIATTNGLLYDYYGENPKAERYELKDIDGKKFVIDMSEMNVDIVTELSYAVPRLTRRFPFLKIERKKYTRLVLSRLKSNEKLAFDVDCNIGMLMKILNIEYSSWSKSVMNECVKNGSLRN